MPQSAADQGREVRRLVRSGRWCGRISARSWGLGRFGRIRKDALGGTGHICAQEAVTPRIILYGSVDLLIASVHTSLLLGLTIPW